MLALAGARSKKRAFLTVMYPRFFWGKRTRRKGGEMDQAKVRDHLCFPLKAAIQKQTFLDVRTDYTLAFLVKICYHTIIINLSARHERTKGCITDLKRAGEFRKRKR
jgi:hypothetical protein